MSVRCSNKKILQCTRGRVIVQPPFVNSVFLLSLRSQAAKELVKNQKEAPTGRRYT